MKIMLTCARGGKSRCGSGEGLATNLSYITRTRAAPGLIMVFPGYVLSARVFNSTTGDTHRPCICQLFCRGPSLPPFRRCQAVSRAQSVSQETAANPLLTDSLALLNSKYFLRRHHCAGRIDQRIRVGIKQLVRRASADRLCCPRPLPCTGAIDEFLKGAEFAWNWNAGSSGVQPFGFWTVGSANCVWPG